VLDLSKIEAGKLELNPQTVELAPLIDEVIGTARQLAEQNNTWWWNARTSSPRPPSIRCGCGRSCTPTKRITKTTGGKISVTNV
jgi:signal transduction histidine kinase